MYFEIENTPESGKKRKESTTGPEETYVLALEPFAPSPTITFDDVQIGTKCSKTLFISNRKQQAVQIAVQKRSDDVTLELSWLENVVLPHQTIQLDIGWQPLAPISIRTVLNITDRRKGRYDVPVICKSVDKRNAKGTKKGGAKGKLRRSPVKVSKPKSPKAAAAAFLKKQKPIVSYKTIERKFESESIHVIRSPVVCLPKNVPRSNFNRDFAHFEELRSDPRRETYSVPRSTMRNDKENFLYQPTPTKMSTIKTTPENKGSRKDILSAIENLEFTPLKSLANNANISNPEETQTFHSHTRMKKSENIERFDNDCISINLIEEDCSLEIIETQYIKKVTHVNAYNNCQDDRFDHLKLPPTNEFSYSKSNDNVFKTPYFKGIESDNCFDDFDPKRCSTEKKCEPKCSNTYDFMPISEANDSTLNISAKRLSSETYTKGDSPIVPLDPGSNRHLQSSPYLRNLSPKDLFTDFPPKNAQSKNEPGPNACSEATILRNAFKEKNNFNGARDVIEADLWLKPQPYRLSPTPLCSIPEEHSEVESETTYTVKRKPYSEIIMNETFDKSSSFKLPKTREKKYSNVGSTRKPKSTASANFKSGYEVDVYSMASIVDPFMASSYLYDEEAFDKLETEYKRWLNYLLTPPTEFDTKLEVDLGKAWLESRTKSIPAAPTKEQVSLSYTSHRLESLRKAAAVLIKSNEMSQVFSKIVDQAERKKLTIRADKNLHLDIGLQKIILKLLLSYNPLWLRIGLEAIYRKVIPISSNNDIHGLSDFIIENMFKNPKSKFIILDQSYAEEVKKFTLKNFLFLVYFLDKAKEKKLIFHDPCLFCRNSEYKESEKILFEFTKELLSGVGDITKHLKRLGYVVSYKQKCIHEYKYGVENLAVDLKDGVRLTRLMEIILQRDDLLLHLWTPAETLLRKVHNVQIALSALTAANFEIVGKITARDIAEGHREKTLSLMWQLINKFRAPLFENAAISIQKWWRKHYLKVWIRNKIKRRRAVLLNANAIIIQSWWKGILCRRQVQEKIRTEKAACLLIQRWWKTMKYQRDFKNRTIAAKKIQRWYLKCKQREHFELNNEERKTFLLQKKSVTIIQTWYRKIISIRYFKSTNTEFQSFIQIKTSSIKIQRWYRKSKMQQQLKMLNVERPLFLLKKSAAIKIQNWYRRQKTRLRLKSSNIDRPRFLLQRYSAIKIQNWYRKIKLQEYLKSQNYDRPRFLLWKTSAIQIQMWYRKKKSEEYFKRNNIDRDQFLAIRAAAIIIQSYYRLHILRNELRKNNTDRPLFLMKRSSAIIIQKWYRQIKLRRYLASQNTDRPQYLKLKSSAIKIQQWSRKRRVLQELKKNNKDRPVFLLQKSSAITIQKWYRKLKLLQHLESLNVDRPLFVQKKSSAIKIQIWYRKIKLQQYLESTNIERPLFLRKRQSAITIQRCYRKKKLQERLKLQNTDRPTFLVKKMAAIKIQRWHRRNVFLKSNRDRLLYSTKKSSAVKIQQWYRKMKMRRFLSSQNFDRQIFLNSKCAATKIQTWYRKVMLVRQLKLHNTDRSTFLMKKAAASKIQTWYREVKDRQRLAALAERDRSEYLLMKSSALKIQSWYRNVLWQRNNTLRPVFLLQRSSAIVIQRWYRKKLQYRQLEAENVDRPKFLLQKFSATKIQTWYRLCQIRRELAKENQCRSKFLIQRSSAVKIQKWFRHVRWSKTNHTREYFLQVQSSTVKIQRLYRAKIAMQKERRVYLCIRLSVIKIQSFVRAIIARRIARTHYSSLRMSTIIIQRRFRANRLMIESRKQYLEKRNAAVAIQRAFRSYILLKRTRECYLRWRKSCVCIQRFYRNYTIMKREKEAYNRKLKAIIFIQTYYRGYCLMKRLRYEFILKKKSAITIQTRWREYQLMQKHRLYYLNLKGAIIYMQRLIRKRQLQLKEAKTRRVQNNAAVKIQSYWRGYNLRRKQRDDSQIRKLRERWQNGGLQSTQSTLGERNDDALDVISRFKDIASIIRAFKTLDFITNVYPMMYSANEVKRICRSLIIYMDATNRSVSALETLRLGIAILANLTRYKHTAAHSFNISYVDTLLSLMTRWCEKDHQLSCSICTLLWLYAKYDDFKAEIIPHLKRPDSYKTLCKVRSLLVRKKKMDSHKKCNQVNASLLFSTPVKKSHLNLVKYPMLEPDYGLSKSSVPKYFQNETDAINAIFVTYDLPLNVIKL